jgi:hypothetical protein
MSDYQELVKKEAKAFFDGNFPTYLEDAEEFGGKSAAPSFPRWIDRTAKLSARIGEVMAKWGMKELHWVQTNTRNKIPHGDLRGNSFGSLLQDVRHELKRLAKEKGA